MTKIDLALIQQLRECSGAGMMDCKNALIETNGDTEKAMVILRKKGASIAGNATHEGIVHAYIHPGAKLGVLLEINCETDFVARTDDMKKFAQDVCMHIAALNPKFVGPEQVDAAFMEKERKFFTEQLKEQKKPENMIEKIVEGKMDKLFQDVCLLKQKYVKDDSLTVEQYLQGLIAKLGEKIKINRFVRFEI